MPPHLVGPWPVGLHLDTLEALSLHLGIEGCACWVLGHVDGLTEVYELHETRAASEHHLRVFTLRHTWARKGKYDNNVLMLNNFIITFVSNTGWCDSTTMPDCYQSKKSFFKVTVV